MVWRVAQVKGSVSLEIISSQSAERPPSTVRAGADLTGMLCRGTPYSQHIVLAPVAHRACTRMTSESTTGCRLCLLNLLRSRGAVQSLLRAYCTRLVLDADRGECKLSPLDSQATLLSKFLRTLSNATRPTQLASYRLSRRVACLSWKYCTITTVRSAAVEAHGAMHAVRPREIPSIVLLSNLNEWQ